MQRNNSAEMSFGLGSLPRAIQSHLIHNLWVLPQELRPPVRWSKTSWDQRLITEISETPTGYLINSKSEEGHTPCRPPPKLLLLKLFPENYWGDQVFWAWASPFISPLQTSTFQFTWPHCALNTQTWFRQEKKKKKDVTGSAEHWWSRLWFGWKDVLEMRYWGKPLTMGTNERTERYRDIQRTLT